MAAERDVIVIGSAMVEVVPAEMGRPLARVNAMIPLPSGSAANFAIALAALDVSVSLLSRVGDDELGQWLIAALSARGIDTEFITPVADQLTPVSFAWMDQSGAKTFYFYRFPGYSDPMATLTRDTLDPAQVTCGRLFDFTEAGVRNEPLRSATFAAAELARRAGREVCYAVNWRPHAWREQSHDEIIGVQRRACAAADIVVMNRDEARLITGCDDPEQAIIRVAELGPSLVVITDGARGALLLGNDRIEHVPARSVPVVYDIGAGDAFHAGLVAAHLAGLSPPAAARFASDAAALRISRDVSAPPPGFDEVMALTRRPL